MKISEKDAINMRPTARRHRRTFTTKVMEAETKILARRKAGFNTGSKTGGGQEGVWSNGSGSKDRNDKPEERAKDKSTRASSNPAGGSMRGNTGAHENQGKPKDKAASGEGS